MLLRNRLSPRAKAKIGSLEPPSPEWIKANTPRAGSQAKVLSSPADVIFYGGQPGGGKTTAGAMLCLQQGQQTIIYRREFVQLRPVNREIERLVGPYGKPNKAKHFWIVNYPCWQEGQGWTYKKVEIQLSGCRSLTDAEKRQGDARDIIIFDEICHFPQEIFLHLLGWNRSTNNKCKILVTGNPPTSNVGTWVKNFWGDWLRKDAANPAEPGELRWFAFIYGEKISVENGEPFEHHGEKINPFSMTVFPSLLEENTTLWESGYIQKVQMMPEPIRSQMLATDLREAFDSNVKDDAWQIIPRQWVSEAIARWRPRQTRIQTAVGADIARGGDDQLAIIWRSGDWVAPLTEDVNIIKGAKVTDGDTAAVAIINNLYQKTIPIFLDSINVGTSVFDYLKHQGYRVGAIKGGDRCDLIMSNGLGFKNLATALWWNLRELLRPPSKIALPNDPKLIEDLCSTRYFVTSRGKIAKEKKSEVRKRLGRSPDLADALSYAFADYILKITREGVVVLKNPNQFKTS